jgi:hypothetical protein
MGRKAREKLERRMKGGQERRRSTRRWRRRWGLRSLLALALIGGGAATWLGTRAPAPEPAPRFNLLASTGRVVTLDEFLGTQEVVLIFYMVAT